MGREVDKVKKGRMIIDAHIHLWNPLYEKVIGVNREALSWRIARQCDRVYYALLQLLRQPEHLRPRPGSHDYLGINRAVVLQEFDE
jgi:predicted TIM-barrel fold metal-dependent hydrolase